MIGHGALFGARLDLVPRCPGCQSANYVIQQPKDSGRYECKMCGRSGFDLEGKRPAKETT